MFDSDELFVLVSIYGIYISFDVAPNLSIQGVPEFPSRIGAEEVGPEFRGVPRNSYASGPPYTLFQLMEIA